MERNNATVLILAAAGLLGAVALGIGLRGPSVAPAVPEPIPVEAVEAAPAHRAPEPRDPNAPRVPPETWGEPYQVMELKNGLVIGDIVVGKGLKQPQTGDYVLVEYSGWLEDGTLFDSSYKRSEAFRFPVGMNAVIAGWDIGVQTMVPGGKRQLRIPSSLAYGPQGRPPVIPPNATLIFDIELLEILPGRDAPTARSAVPADAWTALPNGLRVADLVVGDGMEVSQGTLCEIDYSGWFTDGSKYDSSLDRAAPIIIELGSGQLIPGLDEGIKGMKVGGKRQLEIPYKLAYGEEGRTPNIPPKADMIFDIELVSAK